jgi:hypothetical protein
VTQIKIVKKNKKNNCFFKIKSRGGCVVILFLYWLIFFIWKQYRKVKQGELFFCEKNFSGKQMGQITN